MRVLACLVVAALAAIVPTASATTKTCSPFHGPCSDQQALGGDCSAGAASGAGSDFVDLFAVWFGGQQSCSSSQNARSLDVGSQLASFSWSKQQDGRTGRTQTSMALVAGPADTASWEAYDGAPGQPCSMQAGGQRLACLAGDPLPPPSLPWGFLLP